MRGGDRHRRLRNNRRRAGLILAGSVLAFLALTASLTPAPDFVWNASASVPIGLYQRLDGPIKRGDLVLAWLPAGARELADERGYLPGNVPLVKRVAALAGDMVCAVDTRVFINGVSAATRLQADNEGRALPAWEGCNLLQPGQVLLLAGNVPDSFDSRYFGAVGRRQIIGRLVRLWIK